MNALWSVVILGFAGLTAYVTLRRWFWALEFPAVLLIGLVLLVVFQLLPVHLAATLEVVGLTDSFTLSTTAMIAALTFVGTVAVFRGVPEAPASPHHLASLSSGFKELPGYIRVAVAISAASWLVFVMDVLVSYSFGWDGVAYHLPLAVSWLQDQSLVIPPDARWDLSLPSNAEVSMMLFLATGLHSLAALFNLIAFIIAACAVYIIAFRITQNKLSALICVLLLSTIPIVQFQANSAYVDLYGSSFIIAGAATFLFRNDPQTHVPASTWYLLMVVLTGLCWGVAIGTKPIFYAYAGLSTAILLAVAWSERREAGVSPVLIVAVLGLAMLVPSYFWFLRAVIATGNPIYPIPVSLFGATILEGVALNNITSSASDMQFLESRSRLEWLIYPWVEFKRTGFNYGTGQGLGAVWATFVPLGLVYGIYLTGLHIRDRTFRLYVVLLLAFVVAALLWWFGLRKLLRFAIPLFILSCVLVAPLFDLFIRRRIALFKALVIGSVATTAIIATFVPGLSILRQVRAGEWSRTSALQYPAMVNELPEDSTIWNTIDARLNFPLAGSDLTNRVVRGGWPGIEAAAQFIAVHQVDYIVERHPFCCEELASLGARLVFDDMVQSKYRWRVWQIDGGQAE